MNPSWDKADIEDFKNRIKANSGCCPANSEKQVKCPCSEFVDGCCYECPCGFFVKRFLPNE